MNFCSLQQIKLHHNWQIPLFSYPSAESLLSVIHLYILESTHSDWQIYILLHSLVLLSQVFQILRFSQNPQTAGQEPCNHIRPAQKPFPPVFSGTQLRQELHLLQSLPDRHLPELLNWHFQGFFLNNSFHLQQAFLLRLQQEQLLLPGTYRMYRHLFHFLPLHSACIQPQEVCQQIFHTVNGLSWIVYVLSLHLLKKFFFPFLHLYHLTYKRYPLNCALLQVQ